MSYHIKYVILPLHVLGVISALFIAATPATFSWPLFLLGWFAIYGLGLVVGFHKLLSHRSFTTNRYVEYVLAYLGCLGVSGSPIWWAAIHRGHHHAKTETDADLQSPRHGWWHSYIGWQFGDATSRISLAYAKDLLRYKVYVIMHDHYLKIIWGTLFITAVLGGSVVTSLLIFPMLAAHHGENITNLLGHSRFAGYRNFETNDDTVNNPILALLTWGQLLHNNHHAKPAADTFAVKWWEFDPTAPVVWLLKKLK